MRRLFFVLLYLTTLIVGIVAAWRGRDYYLLPLLDRPHHPQHWELKPGGSAGLRFGVAGAVLMTAMLS